MAKKKNERGGRGRGLESEVKKGKSTNKSKKDPKGDDSGPLGLGGGKSHRIM